VSLTHCPPAAAPAAAAAAAAARYFHKGSLLYVGGDKAGADLPLIGPLVGYEAGLLWHSYETFAQISLRNQAMVAINWLRTKLFGRNISHI
jgi:NADH:ubiquinone reductase (non-electrogenic)